MPDRAPFLSPRWFDVVSAKIPKPVPGEDVVRVNETVALTPEGRIASFSMTIRAEGGALELLPCHQSDWDLHYTMPFEVALAAFFGDRARAEEAYRKGALSVKGDLRKLNVIDRVNANPSHTELIDLIRDFTADAHAVDPLWRSENATPKARTLAALTEQITKEDYSRFPRSLDEATRSITAGLCLGLQLAVVRRNEIVLSVALGDAAVDEAMGRTDLLLWYSCSKPITTFAILALCDADKLRLHDHISSFLDEFDNDELGRLTIVDLLCHTTGVRSDPTLNSLYATPATTRPLFSHLSIAEPTEIGSRATYAYNWSWFALACVVEEVSGVFFDEFVRDEVFSRVGLSSTWLCMREEEYRKLAPSVRPVYDVQGVVPALTPYSFSPAACQACVPGMGARGTADDLAKLTGAFLLPKAEPNSALVSTELLRVATSEHSRERRSGGEFRYGLGFELEATRAMSQAGSGPRRFGNRCSEATFGHHGGTSTVAFADPANEVVMALVTNGIAPAKGHIRRVLALCDAVYEDLSIV